MKIILKWSKYKSSQGWKIRLYGFESYTLHKRFEALAFMFGKRIFWIFEKSALENWPSTN